MMNFRRYALIACCGLTAIASTPVHADGVADIVNFRQYSAGFASAGQPTPAQLEAVKTAGFERVIYVAYSDQPKSLANEDRLVKDLGMEYVHIPVAWDAPTRDDFGLIAAALGQSPQKKTLLHCQVNYRASAFAFLYRVLFEDVPVGVAKADMNSVWTPNQTWRDLIFDVLEAEGVSADCDGCDWTPSDD